MDTGAVDISEILPELTVKYKGLELPPALDPEQARFRLLLSVTTFLNNVSRHRPIMLFLLGGY